MGFRSAFSSSPYIRREALQMTVYPVFTCISPYFKIYTLVVFALKLSKLYRKCKIVLTSSTQYSTFFSSPCLSYLILKNTRTSLQFQSTRGHQDPKLESNPDISCLKQINKKSSNKYKYCYLILLCILLCRLTIQDQLVLCQYGEGLQRARMWAWQWSHCQVSVTSHPDAMTVGVAAGCLKNVACRGASPLPACRMAMWKTHWGSSQRTLWCPEKRQIWEWLNPKWNNNVVHASATV